MVRARPELFYAYVGTGQVADEAKNYSAAYDALLQKAQASGNEEAIEELKRVGPPPYANGEATLGFALAAPGGSVQDISDSGDGQMLSGERLVGQTKSKDRQSLGWSFLSRCSFSKETRILRLQRRSRGSTSSP